LTAAELSHYHLYGIVDLGYVTSRQVPDVAREMIDGGVDLIQLRAKTQSLAEITALARELHEITMNRNVPLVINDYAEVAREIGAEGVHIGQDDPAMALVRNIVGPSCMIGKSTHSFDQAIRAADEGADYIGFGPLFATPTKPDYIPIGLNEIEKVHQAIRIPIFCIGGIKLDNLSEVIAAGAQRVVIVSGLLQAKDIASYARSIRMLLAKSKN
jgi:thiamine-phosphate pyrophosphorylase